MGRRCVVPYGWNGWLFVPYTGSTLNPGEIHLVLVSLKFEFSQVSAWYAFSLLYLCLYLSFRLIYLVTSTMDFFCWRTYWLACSRSADCDSCSTYLSPGSREQTSPTTSRIADQLFSSSVLAVYSRQAFFSSLC